MLQPETPVHGAGRLHIEVMRVVDIARETLERAARGIGNTAVVNERLLDKGRVVNSTEKVIAFNSLVEDTVASAQYSRLVAREIVCKAQARLPRVPIGVCCAFWKPTEERLNGGIFGRRNTVNGGLGEAVPTESKTVVDVSAVRDNRAG